MKQIPEADRLEQLLTTSRTIAVIGSSDKIYRASFMVTEYLLEEGFEVIPINPNVDRVLGKICWNSLDELTESPSIDIVVIFRNKSYTAGMVREIVAWAEKNRMEPVIWTQLDVSTDEARELAEEAGLRYIENRCIMAEHQALRSAPRE